VDSSERLELAWEEAGGPPVQPPRRHGFGTTMINHSVGRALGGRYTPRFDPQGFSAVIELPLDRVAADAA